MKINQISRISHNHAREAAKDLIYLIDEMISRNIDIENEYDLHHIKNNKDLCLIITTYLARCDIIKTERVSEIRSCITEDVPLSEKDHHEDLANGIDVKRCTKIQCKVSVNGTKNYHWYIANLGNKKGDIIVELTHSGRKWVGKIPKDIITGLNTISVKCDPNTGEPDKRGFYATYFKETTI